MLLTWSARAQAFGDLDKYLQSDSVSAVAKEYYYERVKTTLNDSTIMIADSMMSKNTFARPFYMMLVSRMYMTAEAELATRLFGYCYRALDSRPGEVADFLYSKSNYVNSDFKEYWATALAFYLRKEQPDDTRAFVEKQQEAWLKHCKKKDSKEHLNAFLDLLYARL